MIRALKGLFRPVTLAQAALVDLEAARRELYTGTGRQEEALHNVKYLQARVLRLEAFVAEACAPEAQNV